VQARDFEKRLAAELEVLEAAHRRATAAAAAAAELRLSSAVKELTAQWQRKHAVQRDAVCVQTPGAWVN
jgi:hypothetical protein